MELARDAVDAEAVGPVRRDLQLEHVRVERDQLRERRSGLEPVRDTLVVEHDDARVVGADRELVLREDHPLGGDAAELSRRELGAVGQPRPGPRHGDALAGGDVRSAADDRGGSLGTRAAEIDLADP